MVGKKDLKVRDLETINHFFLHIINNQINGNHSDVKKFIKMLSKSQKLEFHYFIQTSCVESERISLQNHLIEILLNPDY